MTNPGGTGRPRPPSLLMGWCWTRPGRRCIVTRRGVGSGCSWGRGMNGTVLVGREQELALLRAEIGRSGAGEARSVFIRGEPGIGKTSLAAAAAAGDPDFQVVAASGEESEQDLAYGVADQLLRRLGADSPEPAGPGPLAVGATLLRALSDLQSRAPI